jgi:LEA14-like dessication related protein
MQQMNEMAMLTKCQFRLASVQQATLAGVPVQGGKVSDISPMNLLKLQSAFATGTLPMEFTLNMEAKNPNATPASMSRMAWTLFVDDRRMTSGILEQNVQIPANNGVGTIPLRIALDLKQTLSGETLNSMINLAMNVAGQGTQPTRLSLQAKPSITVSGRTLDYPGHITVSHEFTSK